MTEIVEELARRATPGYLGERIKEATVNKTKELRVRASGSPTTLAMIGAGIGAAAGALLARSRMVSDASYMSSGDTFDESFGAETSVGHEESGGITERAKEIKDQVKDRASRVFDDARTRSADAVGDVRDRAYDVGYRSADWVSRAWREQPLLVSAGLAIAGALAAMLIPETEREQRMAEPVRRKTAEKIQELGSKVEAKIDETMGAGSKTSEAEGIAPPASQPETTFH